MFDVPLLRFSTLESHEDRSVNHVAATPDGGFFEARFVQREDPYFICYVSSHSGCKFACKFCHLTATRQTMMTPATAADYQAQCIPVFETYRARLAQGLPHAKKVHFNFMSRGEALANPTLLAEPQSVFDPMGDLAKDYNLSPHFKVSSILPVTFNGDLAEVLADSRAELYYSLYSVNPTFRKRWLGHALPAEEGLDRVADYQRRTGRRVVLHWAFIAGQNDSEQDVEALLDAVVQRGIRAKFNLVRYNPHDARHGVEPTFDILQARFKRIEEVLVAHGGEAGSRIVPRVGFDVKASCGMFIEKA
jgi:adenine C2-methylase RlmN of 23S rRNA A2503 and tRNA A37